MNILEIYDKYNLHSGLREHMLRVASVAKMICEAIGEKVDGDRVVKACLLHDLGNLIKYKFDVAPDLFEPEGVDYWRSQQLDMIKRFGDDVSVATNMMAGEVTKDEVILRIIDEMSFDKVKEIAVAGSMEVKIALYADMRVGMSGVVAIDGRFNDLKKRYVPTRFSAEECDSRREATIKIEHEIFADINLKPEEIDDSGIALIQDILVNTNVH